jgi:hypothetical protein
MEITPHNLWYFDDGKWHHLVIISEDGLLKVYIDGELKQTNKQ